jgi:hypothetical protein
MLLCPAIWQRLANFEPAIHNGQRLRSAPTNAASNVEQYFPLQFAAYFLNAKVSRRSFPAACCLVSRQCQIYAESVESLMRLREPAAWVALGALVLNLVLALVGLATFEGPLVSMGWMWSERVANPMSLLALAILVSVCVLHERTPHARQLTLVSLVVGVIAVLLGLTLALLGIGATAPILAVLAEIVPQTISIIAVGLLIKLLQMQAVPRRLPPGIGLVVVERLRSDLDQERADLSDSLSAPSRANQRLQPTWHADKAAGVAWRSAVDAAAGGTAAAGETDAPTVRWQHIPTPTNGSGPDDRMPGDPAIQPTVPMPEEQLTVPMPGQEPLGRPGDPSADQEQWNSRPLALDWSGSPQYTKVLDS